MTLYSGMGRLNENCVPNVKNTSFTVTATRQNLSDQSAQRAIIARGGKFGGWCLYFRDGHPAFGYNWVGLETFVIKAATEVGEGDHVVAVEFEFGGGAGKGGTARVLVDDTKVAKGRIDKTVPGVFSFDDFLDVGQDGGRGRGLRHAPRCLQRHHSRCHHRHRALVTP